MFDNQFLEIKTRVFATQRDSLEVRSKGLLKNNLRKFLTSYMMSFRDKYHGHPDEIQEIVSLDERTISTYLGSN